VSVVHQQKRGNLVALGMSLQALRPTGLFVALNEDLVIKLVEKDRGCGVGLVRARKQRDDRVRVLREPYSALTSIDVVNLESRFERRQIGLELIEFKKGSFDPRENKFVVEELSVVGEHVR